MLIALNSEIWSATKASTAQGVHFTCTFPRCLEIKFDAICTKQEKINCHNEFVFISDSTGLFYNARWWAFGPCHLAGFDQYQFFLAGLLLQLIRPKCFDWMEKNILAVWNRVRADDKSLFVLIKKNLKLLLPVQGPFLKPVLLSTEMLPKKVTVQHCKVSENRLI